MDDIISKVLPTPIVSVDWLHANLKTFPNLVVIDGSWNLEDGAKRAKEQYSAQCIPNAVFFDIDEIADKSTHLPHMAPSAEVFQEAVAHLGISNDASIIVYDQVSMVSAARVWWTFRFMGHEAVAVLDGGLPAWKEQNGPIEKSRNLNLKAAYHARIDQARRASHTDIRKNDEHMVIDARPNDRFIGNAPEPRAGLRRGAMPGAVNIPVSALISNGRIRSKSELSSIFAGAGFEGQKVITTCGSGVAAAVVCLSLDYLGFQNWRLYDGSWSEWGREQNDAIAFPVVTAAT